MVNSKQRPEEEPQAQPERMEAIERAIEKGDNLEARRLAKAALSAAKESQDAGAQSFSEAVLQSLAPDRLALILLASCLLIWGVAFTLGVVLRHG